MTRVGWMPRQRARAVCSCILLFVFCSGRASSISTLHVNPDQPNPTPGLTLTLTLIPTLLGGSRSAGAVTRLHRAFWSRFSKKSHAAEIPALINNTRILHNIFFMQDAAAHSSRHDRGVYLVLSEAFWGKLRSRFGDKPLKNPQWFVPDMGLQPEGEGAPHPTQSLTSIKINVTALWPYNSLLRKTHRMSTPLWTGGAPWPPSPNAGSPARAATSPPRKVATGTRWGENPRSGFPEKRKGVILFLFSGGCESVGWLGTSMNVFCGKGSS